MSATAARAAAPARRGARFDPRGLVLPLLALIVWQLWALTLPHDSPAPSPARVIATFIELVRSGDLPSALAMSLGRVIAGFATGLATGVTVGVLMGAFRPVRRVLEPIIESFRPVAPMAILPIAILWFGTGTPAAVSIVGYAAFFPLLVNTVHGVSRVDRKLVQAARTMGVSRPRILAKVVLPAAMPSIMLGARLGMSVAWTAIIAAELAVGSKSGGGNSGGIGSMMFVFYAYSVDLNGIVVCMIVVGVVALLIDQLFRAAEARLLPWRQ
ncbi:MAG: ABC transporter permease [Rhodospirillales bacterium]|nr:ABC transporter permease [Rhodospirillales bacterium]MDE2199118.1 ABC transporter permease [Rhodospirillales bacterium]MDE2573767.1 ABC transporter permease [Rhodospirillales bacterium]